MRKHVRWIVLAACVAVAALVLWTGGCDSFWGVEDESSASQDNAVAGTTAPDTDAVAATHLDIPPAPKKAPADIAADTMKDVAPALPPPWGTVLWAAGSALGAAAVGYRKVRKSNRRAEEAAGDAEHEAALRDREEALRATERELAAAVAGGMEAIKAKYPKAWDAYKAAIRGAEGTLEKLGYSEAHLREFIAGLQKAELEGAPAQET